MLNYLEKQGLYSIVSLVYSCAVPTHETLFQTIKEVDGILWQKMRDKESFDKELINNITPKLKIVLNELVKYSDEDEDYDLNFRELYRVYTYLLDNYGE